MKVYLKNNVYEGAIERIEMLFNDFEDIIVCVSGGKDSTVLFYLCLEVAKKLNRLPLRILWIDQEAEWEHTVSTVEEIMTHKDVDPLWLQIPLKLTNNFNSEHEYFTCWDENEKENWVHTKNDLSIKENRYNERRFKKIFTAIIDKETSGKACYISGVRVEESPSRFMGLTTWATYKHITWGKVIDEKKEQFTFYPIYDWSYTDVWKYIHDNNLPYNKIYDYFYRYGVNIRDMRISGLYHETAIQHLMQVHEIEPDTWNKVIKRMGGANTIKQLSSDSIRCPKELPHMFESWKEYAEHLAMNLIKEESHKEKVLSMIENERGIKGTYKNGGKAIKKDLYRSIINVTLSSDWDYTKLTNWEDSPDVSHWRKYNLHGHVTEKTMNNKYVNAG